MVYVELNPAPITHPFMQLTILGRFCPKHPKLLAKGTVVINLGFRTYGLVIVINNKA